MSRGSGGGFEITRSVFAALQAAIAFAAVAAAVFAARGVAQYASTNPGFRPENLATMQIIAPPAKYSGAPKRLALVESLLQKIRGMPGVEMAGGTSELALSGQSNDVLFLIDGRSPVAPGGRPSYAGLRIVTPDYFKAMGVPLVKGRLFEPGDAGKPNVVLISDVLEREYFFLDDPLGKQVVIDLGEKWTGQIAGVVGSIRHANLGAAPAREIYISNFQRPTGGLNLVVKTRQGADLNALRTSITEQVKTMDPEIPVAQFRTMEAVIADSVAQARLFAMIVETAAGAAVLMSALAFYALAGSLAAGRSKAAFSQPFLRGAASAVAGFAIGFGLWQWLAGSLPAVTASLDKGGTLSAVVALSVMAVVGAASLFLGGRGTIQRRA
jgi:putative ABC transport system permease protein